MEKWKILDSKYLIQRPWLTARLDRVELPDGRINNEFYVLEYPDWVNVIAVTKKGEFVMIEQYRHGISEIVTEIPAGVIEKGEDPLDAAKRELLEETGFGGGEWSKFMTLSPNSSTSTNFTHTYLAIGVEQIGTQHLDSTEDLQLKIMTKEDVYSLLEKDLVKQALMAAPLWKYFALYSPETIRR